MENKSINELFENSGYEVLFENKFLSQEIGFYEIIQRKKFRVSKILRLRLAHKGNPNQKFKCLK